MKAAVQHRYGPPGDVVTVEDVATPEPGPDEVLVRVRAAGVNWADRSMTTGIPYVMRLGYGLRRPREPIRGTDVAGVVEQIGSAVTRHQPGDEVFGWCTAAFADYVTAHQDHLLAKPARISFEQAAGIPMTGCVALQALRDIAKTSTGDKVLVNGATGGIGSFVVQIARSLGAEVTAICSTPNLDLARSLGAHHVIDYTTQDYTKLGERYDLIFDVADNRTLRERRQVLTRRGTLIPNSGEGGPITGSIGRIFKAWIMSPFVTQKLRPFLSITKQVDLEALCQLIETGDLDPVVGHTYALADTGTAIAHAGSGHARGKIVITLAA